MYSGWWGSQMWRSRFSPRTHFTQLATAIGAFQSTDDLSTKTPSSVSADDIKRRAAHGPPHDTEHGRAETEETATVGAASPSQTILFTGSPISVTRTSEDCEPNLIHTQQSPQLAPTVPKEPPSEEAPQDTTSWLSLSAVNPWSSWFYSRAEEDDRQSDIETNAKQEGQVENLQTILDHEHSFSASEGWKLLLRYSSKDIDLHIFKQKLPKESVETVKSVVLLRGVSPSAVFKSLSDVTERIQWDNAACVQYTVQEKFSDHSDAVYSKFKLPFGVTDRDFLDRRWWSHAQGVYILNSKATTLESMPPQNHVVRGETLVNGFIVKRDAEEPEITRVDLKGYLPVSVIHRFAKQQMESWVIKLYQHAQELTTLEERASELVKDRRQQSWLRLLYHRHHGKDDLILDFNTLNC